MAQIHPVPGVHHPEPQRSVGVASVGNPSMRSLLPEAAFHQPLSPFSKASVNTVASHVTRSSVIPFNSCCGDPQSCRSGGFSTQEEMVTTCCLFFLACKREGWQNIDAGVCVCSSPRRVRHQTGRRQEPQHLRDGRRRRHRTPPAPGPRDKGSQYPDHSSGKNVILIQRGNKRVPEGTH